MAELASTNTSEAVAGLAWRQERRRAKLTIRLLRQLLSAVHTLAGSRTCFPKGPVSGLDISVSAAIVEEPDVEEVEYKVLEMVNCEQDPTLIEVVEDEEADETDFVVNDAPKMAELESIIQTCLDEIVQVCRLNL